MNCTKCKTKAVISLPRHNAAFCKGCFNGFVHDQVARAIKSEQMFRKEIEFSSQCPAGRTASRSGISCSSSGIAPTRSTWISASGLLRAVACQGDELCRGGRDSHGATLLLHMVEQEAGAGINELAQLIHRPTCSTCGTIKRYQFNRAAVEQDYDVMATGHNLDDEAARLLGNVLHWQEEYLDKQGPSLPASVEGFAKKVKPLCRLSERELAAYAVVNRIEYIVEECPMAKGAKMLHYKEVLNRLETESPGTKQRSTGAFSTSKPSQSPCATTMAEKDRAVLPPCASCGQPTTAEVCSYCKMMARARIGSPR